MHTGHGMAHGSHDIDLDPQLTPLILDDEDPGEIDDDGPTLLESPLPVPDTQKPYYSLAFIQGLQSITLILTTVKSYLSYVAFLDF